MNVKDIMEYFDFICGQTDILELDRNTIPGSLAFGGLGKSKVLKFSLSFVECLVIKNDQLEYNEKRRLQN
jgi:hypothetical protein